MLSIYLLLKTLANVIVLKYCPAKWIAAVSVQKNDAFGCSINWRSIQHIIPNVNVIKIPYFTADTTLLFFCTNILLCECRNHNSQEYLHLISNPIIEQIENPCVRFIFKNAVKSVLMKFNFQSPVVFGDSNTILVLNKQFKKDYKKIVNFPYSVVYC